VSLDVPLDLRDHLGVAELRRRRVGIWRGRDAHDANSPGRRFVEDERDASPFLGTLPLHDGGDFAGAARVNAPHVELAKGEQEIGKPRGTYRGGPRVGPRRHEVLLDEAAEHDRVVGTDRAHELTHRLFSR
jgi:hypothetical protein